MRFTVEVDAPEELQAICEQRMWDSLRWLRDVTHVTIKRNAAAELDDLTDDQIRAMHIRTVTHMRPSDVIEEVKRHGMQFRP